jgi:enoyl-[acyl-carrier protein] reductase I
VGGFNTILKEIEERSPLRRNVDQEEVGKTAAYLLSDLSSGVTGENIHVEGGFHAIKFFNFFKYSIESTHTFCT